MSDDPRYDYYEILHVSPTADPQAIKDAYNRLALEYHPDRHPRDPSAEKKNDTAE